MAVFLFLCGILAALCCHAAAASTGNNTFLTATAIVTNAQNNSAFECWEFSTPLATSGTAGTSGATTLALGLSEEAQYTVIPPRFDGGIHNAPRPQFVYFASGLIHVTLPHGDDEAWILGGANGLIVAKDTTGTGHRTQYPSDQSTVSLQLPFLDGIAPTFKVLSSGPCHSNSQLVTG